MARWSTARAERQVEVVVPILVDRLKAENSTRRRGAAQALNGMGSNAKAAVPAPIEGTGRPRSGVLRRRSSRCDRRRAGWPFAILLVLSGCGRFDVRAAQIR